MIMIMDVDDHFSFDVKAQADAQNPKVAEWEALMWEYQLPLPWSKAGEKWVLMEEIFHLE